MFDWLLERFISAVIHYQDATRENGYRKDNKAKGKESKIIARTKISV
jgi:hypothetical protein